MTNQQIADKLVELGYTEHARVGKKFKVGEVIFIGHDRYLERAEALRVIKKLEG